ncbi:MAG: ankyrin repeat domain-containing protein [Pirellula sp.]
MLNLLNKWLKPIRVSALFMTLFGDRQYKQARSQAPAAPAWERTVLEARPPASMNSTLIRPAEPAMHLVPRQSLGTRCWRSARSVLFIVLTFSVGQTTSFGQSAQSTVQGNGNSKPITPELVKAIRESDAGRISELLRSGVDVNARDALGNTPLILAATYSQPDVVALLLKNKADVNAANHADATALIRAATEAEKVQLLLAAGAKVAARTKKPGNTPLILASRRNGNSTAVRLLLDNGADPNERNAAGISAILTAAASGDLESVRLLLAKNVDVNAEPPTEPYYLKAVDSGMRTPLMWAAYRNDLPLMRLLLEHKADVNKGTQFGTPLSHAAWHDSFEAAQLLLDKGAVTDTRDFAEFTPLHWAAGTDSPNARLVQLLLDKKADVNAAGGSTIGAFVGVTQTPLLIAQRRGPTAIVKTLQDAGAKVEATIPAVVTQKRHLPNQVDAGLITASVEQAVAGLQTAATVSMNSFKNHVTGQNCVSCHQQNLPMVAVGIARTRSLRIDTAAAEEQIKALIPYNEAFDENRGQPVFHPEPAHGYGYEAQALLHEKVPAGDSGMDAMVHHLIVIQESDGRWNVNLPRPPIQSSDVSATALALLAVKEFGWPGRKNEFDASVDRARKWLWTIQAKTNEDAIYQMLGLHWAGEPLARLKHLADALVAQQRDDGGWGQLPTLPSDAYATGQALYALHLAGGHSVTSTPWQAGIRFLLETQRDDGTWYTPRRAFPFQPTMSSGFPHGRDSWLSGAATSWAVIALTHAIPPGTASPTFPPGTSTVALPTIVAKAQPKDVVHNTEKIDFVRQIKPLLERSCLTCHGPDNAESNYRVDNSEAIFKGGDSGEAAIVVGKSDKSPLIANVSGLIPGMEMPPMAKRQSIPALTKEELQLLRAWVDQGAVWPDDLVLTR